MNLSGAVLLGDQNTSREQQLADLGRQSWNVRQVDRALRALDPYLELVKANSRADEVGLVPDRWHIKRNNPGTIDTYIPLVGENGEYVEPTLDVIDQLRKRDLWREDAQQEIRRFKAEKKARLEAERLALREEKREEFHDRVKAMSSPSIRFGGSGWRASLGDLNREPKREDVNDVYSETDFE